jgi:hypothetical protein
MILYLPPLKSSNTHSTTRALSAQIHRLEVFLRCQVDDHGLGVLLARVQMSAMRVPQNW